MQKKKKKKTHTLSHRVYFNFKNLFHFNFLNIAVLDEPSIDIEVN